MPSTTTTILTSAVTLTSFVTVTTGQYLPSTVTAGQSLPSDIVSPIEGLSQCAQNIVFDSLASSQCNPANFPCICDELISLGAEGRINSTCSAQETAQYVTFQSDVCHNIEPVVPTTTTVIVSTSVSSTVAPISVTVTSTPLSMGYSNITTTQGPFGNSTSVAPITVSTTPFSIATTNSAGKPTTIQSALVSPPRTTSSSPVPSYTGAAAALDVPEFGSVRSVMLAGAMGLMGLVFAEL